MKTPIIMMLLTVVASTAGGAEFKSRAYLPEAGIEVLNRETTESLLDKRLFKQPYAGAVLDRLERTEHGIKVQSVQIVTDPDWNRIVLAGKDRGLAAYDGTAAAHGPLNRPKGVSVTWDGLVFVADSGNDRVLCLQLLDDGESLGLKEVGVIDGLHRPHDVAWSDGGTPWNTYDDRLYIADTGSNMVLRYLVSDPSTPVLEGALGGLGSGPGRFAGPVAVAVEGNRGGHTGRVYVSDAHSGQLVVLRDTGRGLEWDRSVTHKLQRVTSLECDLDGNVYLSSPQDGLVVQMTPELETASRFPWRNPQNFHLVNRVVINHTNGQKTLHSTGDGILISDWDTGISRWNVTAQGGGVAQPVQLLGNHPNPFAGATEVRFRLAGTVPEAVSLHIFDPQGRLVRTVETIARGPGESSLTWDGTTNSGIPAASGVYLYKLNVQGKAYAQKMVVVR